MVNFHNADCMDFMSALPDKAYDLAIVDPPYGIGRDGNRDTTNSQSEGGGRKGFEFKGWDKAIPDERYFIELFRVSKNQIIWGGNYFSPYLPPSMGWIFWDKGQRIRASDGELAFSSFDQALRVIHYNRVELLIQGTIHPTEKPVKLYKTLLRNYANPGDRILDTHGGSCSHAIAAYDLGFDLDIVELDPDYFRAALSRYEAHVAKYSPASEIPVNKQGQVKLF